MEVDLMEEHSERATMDQGSATAHRALPFAASDCLSASQKVVWQSRATLCWDECRVLDLTSVTVVSRAQFWHHNINLTCRQREALGRGKWQCFYPVPVFMSCGITFITLYTRTGACYCNNL